MKIELVELKQTCPMPELMDRIGLGEYAKPSCKSPFREDANPSFGIYQASSGETGNELHLNRSTKSYSKSTSVIERAIAYIDRTPPAIAGEGGHNQTFALTSKLIHGFQLDGSVATELLMKHYNPKCQPEWPPKDIERKVSEAQKTKPDMPSGHLLGKRAGKTPTVRRTKKSETVEKVDYSQRVRDFLKGCRCTEADLIESSPCNIPAEFYRQSKLMLYSLFGEDDLVNIVQTSKQSKDGKWHPVGRGETLPRDEWREKLETPITKTAGGCWFRYNPMDGYGITDKNVTAFKHACIEFDNIPIDLQISLFAKLPLKIRSITHSAGKSIHALVDVRGRSWAEYEAKVNAIYELMSHFGIDANCKNPSRMSRLAGAYRGREKQRLIYLNTADEILAEGIL